MEIEKSKCAWVCPKCGYEKRIDTMRVPMDIENDMRGEE
jgi:hypothetical protein